MRNSHHITANITPTERSAPSPYAPHRHCERSEAISQVQSRDRFVPRDDGGRMDRATSQAVTND